MVESDVTKSDYSLLYTVRLIDKEVLYAYSLKYLEKHAYISSKKLASVYIFDNYNLTYTSMDYAKIKSLLSHKFRHTISILLRENKIIGYSPKLYKRVDIIKSLCVDTPKIDPDIKNNVSHLVYSEGRFVNPKFYNIVGEIFNLLDLDEK